MLPASHAQSSYSVCLSVPSQRSSTIVLAPPATQHSQLQKAPQLAGDLKRAQPFGVLEGEGVLIRWECNYNANHHRLAH